MMEIEDQHVNGGLQRIVLEIYVRDKDIRKEKRVRRVGENERGRISSAFGSAGCWASETRRAAMVVVRGREQRAALTRKTRDYACCLVTSARGLTNCASRVAKIKTRSGSLDPA